MASPPRSPAIPGAVQRIYEQQYITLPLFAALSRLQDQLETGNTEAPLKRVPYNKTPELSWSRQSPQLTPTPSPSPSPKTSHRNLQSFPTPPDTSPQREDSAFISPTIPIAAPRRFRHKRSSRIPLQSPHIMPRRSRICESRALERRFWELDASGRRARRIVGG
ncbi:hypothetical protein CC80DRAFT_518629 [Byssothecium circinans]|uniref:Uncharacterized protein n=1 Tax=Byssothecium circinans TaxID=147558 RepID=A0A6A5TP96_9PLEO|nr:hypothetical protein CC80DRAFT_518629 [Byssothecium circinans]